MTNERVTDFASELVQMAMAMKRVPELEATIESQATAIESYAKQVQRLELNAIDRKNEIDTLHALVRKAEVERDDAELRFLESDDVASTLRRHLSHVIGEAEGVLAACEPAKAPASEMKPLDATPIDESGQSAGFTVHT